MFGVGPQEVVIMVLLSLIIFGPGKASSVARDLGRFVSEARRPGEEPKSELALSSQVDQDEDRRQEFKRLRQ